MQNLLLSEKSRQVFYPLANANPAETTTQQPQLFDDTAKIDALKKAEKGRVRASTR